MKPAFASLNFAVEHADAAELKRWTEVLEGAAVWGGCENVQSRYNEAAKVFSVIVEFDSNPIMLLEAGMTLGFVAREREEQSDNLRNVFGATWTALHDAEGNLIESTL